MMDAASTQPMGGDKKVGVSSQDEEQNSNVATKTEGTQVPRPSFGEATCIVPDSVPASMVTTLTSATGAATNSRSAAEFDAAEMLLGLRKTDS